MKNFNTQDSAVFRIRHLFLVALMLVMAGCSSIKLSYNHGDTLLYWWLNAYVDLDTDQKGWVKQDIDHFFQWHRKTQLKEYQQVLGNAQKQLQGAVTQQMLMSDYDDIRARTQTMLQKAAPELADLARSLKPEQIAQMEKKFNANNDEYRKKFVRVDTAKRQKLRYDKAMEQFELWFGSFSSEQKAVIRKASDARPLDNEIWLDERARRQKNVLNLVQKVQHEKLSKEATVVQVQNLIKESFERMNNAERKPFFDAYNNGTAQMVLTVINMATPAQKAHAQQRLQGWIDDLRTLESEKS